MIRGSALLERWGTALTLTPDRRGLLRTGVALAALQLLYALAWPPRSAHALRYVFGWAGTAAMLFLWLRGLQQVSALEARQRVPRRLLWGGFVVLAGLAVAIPAFHSSDLLAYTNVGRLQTHYGLDPYVHTAVDVPGWRNDALLSDIWKDTPCVYGFLFALIARGVTHLGGGDLARTLLLFKILNVLALALVGWLVASTLRRLGRGGVGLSLFTLLWSPYVLLHVVANGHNDILMVLCILVALRLALDGRWWGIVPALVLGALVKHLALVLLPFAWVHVVRRHGWRKAAVSTALALIPVVVCFAPYAAGFGSARWADIAADITTPRNSFQAALTYTYGQAGAHVAWLAGSAAAFGVAVRLLFALGFLGFYAERWRRAVRRHPYDAEALLEDGAAVLLVLLCIASSLWHPWYAVTFLPLALLLGRGDPVRHLALWVAIFQMLAFTHLGKARVLDALLMIGLPLWLGWRTRARRGQKKDPPTRGSRREQEGRSDFDTGHQRPG